MAPQLALALISPAIAAFMPGVALTVLPAEYTVLLGRLSLAGILLAVIATMVTLFWLRRLRHSRVASAPTWGCGYQRATARMQYTATSFAELAVSVFNGIIRQRVERPVLTAIFPPPARCADLTTETVLERIISPLFTIAGLSFAFLRRLQHGRMHVYMVYIFATLFILMLWAH
jgi:hydrogenase-4 component B